MDLTYKYDAYSTIDCNDLVNAVMMARYCENAPTTDQYWVVISIGSSATRCQLAFRVNATSDIYKRYYSSGSWKD